MGRNGAWGMDIQIDIPTVLWYFRDRWATNFFKVWDSTIILHENKQSSGFQHEEVILLRTEIIERLSMTFTANGKNEAFAVSLQLCVQ